MTKFINQGEWGGGVKKSINRGEGVGGMRESPSYQAGPGPAREANEKYLSDTSLIPLGCLPDISLMPPQLWCV